MISRTIHEPFDHAVVCPVLYVDQLPTTRGCFGR